MDTGAEASFHASPGVVVKLGQTIMKIMTNGGKIIPKEVWAEEDEESELLVKETGDVRLRDVSILLSKQRLERFEELLSAIDFLRSSLGMRVLDFRERMHKRNLLDLPDELIGIILARSKPNLRELYRLQLVCKRFRRLSLSSPKLWSQQRLTPKLSTYAVDTIVKRSGIHGLHVIFNSQSAFDSHTAIQYCNRWSILELHNPSPSDLKRFQSYVKPDKLVSLESVSLASDADTGQTYTFEFNETWSLLSAKKLDCCNVIPQRLCASSLSDCSLIFQNPIDDILIDFLSAANCLERLSITMRWLEVCDASFSSNVELPNLKHFSIHSVGTVHGPVFSLCEATKFPNIISLTGTFAAGASCDNSSVESGFWDLVGGIGVRYPYLKKLRLSVMCQQMEDAEDYSLNSIFKNLPKEIEEVALMVQDAGLLIDTDDDPPYVALTKLRTVGLTFCNMLNLGFSKNMILLFKKHKVQLDGIQIERCDQLFWPILSVNQRDVETVLIEGGVLTSTGKRTSDCLWDEFTNIRTPLYQD